MDYLETYTQVPIGRQRQIFDDGFTELGYGSQGNAVTSIGTAAASSTGGSRDKAIAAGSALFFLAALALLDHRRRAKQSAEKTEEEREAGRSKAAAQRALRLAKGAPPLRLNIFK